MILVVRCALRVLSCVVPVFGKADQIYFLECEIFGQDGGIRGEDSVLIRKRTSYIVQILFVPVREIRRIDLRIPTELIVQLWNAHAVCERVGRNLFRDQLNMFLLDLAVPAADLSVGQSLLDIQYPLDGNPEYREEEGAADGIAAKPVRSDTALKKSIPVNESVRPSNR